MKRKAPILLAILLAGSISSSIMANSAQEVMDIDRAFSQMSADKGAMTAQDLHLDKKNGLPKDSPVNTTCGQVCVLNALRPQT